MGRTTAEVLEDGRQLPEDRGAAAWSIPAELRSSRRIQWAQALILAVLFSVPAILCLRLADASDGDVWWHLRSAEWILQHRAIPHTDPFSSFGAGKPWEAYSWAYELLLLQLFKRLGLVGLVVYTTGMVVSITVVLHHLMRRLQADFTFAALLTAFAACSIYRIFTPRPWLFSILFFALELDVLMQARKTGKIRELAWLPVLFVLWANLHIQFIDGLLVLTIALAETILAHRWTGIQTRLRTGWMCGIFVVCLGGTLVNPYGWNIYRCAYDLATQHDVLDYVQELSAMSFRNWDDWGVLFLTLAAAAVLARARRFAFFESILLVFSVFVSFRSLRDVWVVVIVASAILASGLKGDDENWFQLTAFAAPFVSVATAVTLFLGFRVLHVDNAQLRVLLAKDMPVRAVEVVKENGWNGPLYNDYGWGGYLIWALRMPVSIDGRAALHGDQQITRFDATWKAQPEWVSDPDLLKANLVIGPVKAPLTQLLRMDPRFQLGYEDKLAAVFVARKALSSGPAATAGPEPSLP